MRDGSRRGRCFISSSSRAKDVAWSGDERERERGIQEEMRKWQGNKYRGLYDSIDF